MTGGTRDCLSDDYCISDGGDYISDEARSRLSAHSCMTGGTRDCLSDDYCISDCISDGARAPLAGDGAARARTG